MNKVRRTSPSLDYTVTHLGYQSVDSDDPGLPSDIEVINDAQIALAEAVTLPDNELTPQEGASLALARAIISKCAASPLAGVHAGKLPAASPFCRTAGIYDRSRKLVMEDVSQLLKARDAVDTAIHEVSHHNSGADDGDPRHQAEVNRVVECAIATVQRGDLDHYLANQSLRW